MSAYISFKNKRSVIIDGDNISAECSYQNFRLGIGIDVCDNRTIPRTHSQIIRKTGDVVSICDRNSVQISIERSKNYFQISGAWKLLEGRYITRNDKGVAVVTESLVQPFGVDEPLYEIGDRVKVTYIRGGQEYQYTFRIIGIMTNSASGMGSQSSASMYIPMSAFEQMYETDGVIHLIKLCTKEINQVPIVADKIREKLGYVDVWTMEMSMANLNNVLNTMNAVLGGIAGLSLIVAGVGIINTMTVSIMERTKEIGTMKALGAKSRDIMKMVMSEALLTGVVGGIIGALFGFTLSYIISHFSDIPSASSPSLGILIVGFAMITCVLSGLQPAWRASSLNPVEALRHE